jgi:hypothetical protein
MPEENIVFNDDMNTYYSSLFGEDRLSIGTDILPVVTGSYANSRISMYGAIAHELIGHRRAALFGKTQTNPLLEEVQASIRAARSKGSIIRQNPNQSFVRRSTSQHKGSQICTKVDECRTCYFEKRCLRKTA